MKLKHLKINGFGKIKQKDIDLTPEINVIYGKNEAGKSTLLKFISCMFFGALKTKNGKDISDFDKFKPWKTEEFSGKVEYELKNGENFEVYREFKKKNAEVYNSEKEDISKSFKEDKTKGIMYFEEQTGIDAETYFNTAIIEQAGITLEKASQISIIQKISNLVSSGDDNVSFKKSLAQINKLQTDNVGTDRTSQKPMNNVMARIKALTIKKQELEDLRERQKLDSEEIEELSKDLKIEEEKQVFLKSVNKLSEENKIKYAEINFMKNSQKENEEKIEKLNEELQRSEKERAELEEDIEDLSSSNEKNTNKKFNFIPYIAVIIVCLIALLIMLKNKVASILLVAVSVIDLIVLFVNYKKNKDNVKKINDEDSIKKAKIQEKAELLDEAKARIMNEIEVLKKTVQEKELEIIEKNEKLNKEIAEEKEKIVKEFTNEISESFLESAFEKSSQELLKDLENVEKNISRMKLDGKEIEVNQKLYNEKMEELSKTEENLISAEEEKEELISLNNSYNFAKECLEKAYDEVKKNISPRFTEKLCEIISAISSGKYNDVKFTDDEGLIVELDSGKYVSAESLSLGTIDQMYLSLRLSALNEMSKEKLPIILDETFAYFDNERLENILSYLKTNYNENQILIFTCSNREIEALDKLNIEYNLINLER